LAALLSTPFRKYMGSTMDYLKRTYWWWDIYNRISDDLGIDKHRDEEATIRSAKILIGYGIKFESTLEKARKIINGKNVAVVGGHESFLEQEISEEVVVAADAAFNGIINKGIIPQLLVTDFDGVNINLVKRYRPIVFAHVHGDNYEKYLDIFPEIAQISVPTTQTHPFRPFYNFGGFTDGDRAVTIALALGASKVNVYGFNRREIGKFSGTTNPKTKLKKIYWAYRIIELVRSINDVEVQIVENNRVH